MKDTSRIPAILKVDSRLWESITTATSSPLPMDRNEPFDGAECSANVAPFIISMSSSLNCLPSVLFTPLTTLGLFCHFCATCMPIKERAK